MFLLLKQEEKLEPIKNTMDDPRIRLLNRLYARKRKELKERERLKVIREIVSCTDLWCPMFKYNSCLKMVMTHCKSLRCVLVGIIAICTILSELLGNVHYITWYDPVKTQTLPFNGLYRILKSKWIKWMTVRWMISCHLSMEPMKVFCLLYFIIPHPLVSVNVEIDA